LDTNLVLKPPSEWTLDWHARLEPGANVIFTEDSSPAAVLTAYRALNADHAFEIAYNGHLMANEYLDSIEGLGST